jgi:hypothetical protein
MTMTVAKLVWKGLVGALMLIGSSAAAFDFDRYQPADLDTVLRQQRPQSGATLHAAQPLRFTAALVSYAEACETGFLKRSMIASGIPVRAVDATPLSQCIRIRSAKDAVARVFIQDRVAAYLPDEVGLGRMVTFYALHFFTDVDGPGLLVGEFQTGPTRLGTAPSSAVPRGPWRAGMSLQD